MLLLSTTVLNDIFFHRIFKGITLLHASRVANLFYGIGSHVSYKNKLLRIIIILLTTLMFHCACQ